MTLSVRGLTRNAAAIEAGCLLAALVGSLALVLAIHEVRAATALTEHSDRVLLRSNDLERKVVDLETGLRGYAITRDHVFLRPMLAAQKGIPDELTELQQLVRGDAAQERRAQAISGAVWTYARYWLQPALRLTESDSALVAQMWASVGRERMETIRHRFAAFETAEQKLRVDRANRLSTYEGVVVGLLVAVLLARGRRRGSRGARAPGRRGRDGRRPGVAARSERRAQRRAARGARAAERDRPPHGHRQP